LFINDQEDEETIKKKTTQKENKKREVLFIVFAKRTKRLVYQKHYRLNRLLLLVFLIY